MAASAATGAYAAGTSAAVASPPATPSAAAPSAAAPSAASLTPASYDVRAFGAAGDGVTDDTAAVQAAIDAADQGGTVYFPVTAEFQPYVVSTLYMRDRVRLLGETALVTIMKRSGTAGPVICNHRSDGAGGFATSLLSLVIDGNKDNCPAATDGVGAHPDAPDMGYHAAGGLFRDLMFQNCRRHGGFFGRSDHAMTLPVFDNVRSTYNMGWGLRFVSMSDGWWNVGWLAENGMGAANIVTCGAFRIARVQFEGNDDPRASSFMSDDRPGLQIDGSGIVDIGPGCTFSSTRGALVLNGQCRDINIHDNWFHGNNSHRVDGRWSTVRLNTGHDASRNIHIHHNTFSDRDDTLVGSTSRIKSHFEVSPVGRGSYQDVIFADNIVSTSPTNPHRGVDALMLNGQRGVRVESNRGSGAPAPTILQQIAGSVESAECVTFPQAALDPSDQHSATVDPTRATIRADGWYRLSTSGTWDERIDGTFRSMDIRVNGTSRPARSTTAPDAAGRATWSASATVELRKGDFVEIVADHDVGSPLRFSRAALSIEPI